MPKLSLPDVTLCAVTAVNFPLTIRAMNICLERCDFGDVFMIADQPVNVPWRVEIQPQPFHFSEMVCRWLAPNMRTPFNLLVQWDSWIINPHAWRKSFLKYDYIGARWPWGRRGEHVGNDGFCLQSKKLLDILADWPLPPNGTWLHDTYVGQTIKEELEKKHGIVFATEEVADMFAYERAPMKGKPFGFHGPYNFWRHVSNDEIQNVIDRMDAYAVRSAHYDQLLEQYRQNGQQHIVRLMQTRRQQVKNGTGN